MFIWTTLFVMCLANIWSRMRRIFCNYFGCRNIKPGSQLLQITDSRVSEKEDDIQFKTESGDIDPAPLGCLNPKPVSDYRLQDEQGATGPLLPLPLLWVVAFVRHHRDDAMAEHELELVLLLLRTLVLDPMHDHHPLCTLHLHHTRT